MQSIIPIVTGLFAKVGTAAGVAGVGASTAGAGIVSTLFGAVANQSATNYQNAVLAQSQKLELENAARVRAAGAREAQIQDEEAAAMIGEELGRMGSSGFSVNSQGFLRRRNRTQALATRDRELIYEDANLQAQAAENRAASYAAEIRNNRKSSLFNWLSIPFGIQKSLVAGANLNSSAISNRINNNASFV